MKCFFVVIVFLSTFFSPNTLSVPSKAIRISIFIEKPYAYYENNKLTGQTIEFANALAQKLNMKTQFYICPVARCFSMVKLGQVDMIIDINKTIERQQYMTYLPPYKIQPLPLHFFSLKSKKLNITHYSDLFSLTIGVTRGYTYFDKFDHDSQLNKVSITTKKQLINMLHLGRIDAFIAREESLVTLPEYEKYAHEFERSALHLSKSVPSYLALSKKSWLNGYENIIIEKIIELKKEGVIEQIFQQPSQDIRK